MILYIDTSALVKLLTGERGSQAVDELWNSAASVATSGLAHVEGRAALAAAARSGRLEPAAHTRGKRALAVRLGSAFLVDATRELIAEAGDLAERHRLRGYDAVHLASALTLPADQVLLTTWDADLARAAGERALAVAGPR